MPYLAWAALLVHFLTVQTTDEIYALLEKRREELGLSQADVGARALGKPVSGPLQAIKRGASPSVERLAALANALGLELYFGPQRDEREPRTTSISPDFEEIRRFSAEVSAGGGAENGSAEVVETLAFRREWLDTMNIKPAEAYLLKVRGDSMSPLLSPGDLVLVDQIRRFKFNGQVFAFSDIDGQTRVKRIDQIDKSTLALRSDNPDYPVELRRGEELNRLRILGQIVWSGHSWKD